MDENVYLEVSCSGGHLASGQSAEHIIFQVKTKAKDFGAHRKRLNPASEVVIALCAAGDDQLISYTGRGLTIGIQELPWLNMKANPTASKRMPQRQVSTMHSISTLTVSRERQKPASSMVKPTGMPKTRNAATSVQGC